MKLARWSLHFYRLPYKREVVWAYAAESSSDYALLEIVADNGAVGIAEGVVKPSRTGFSPRSLAASLDEVLLPLLAKVPLEDAAAVSAALAKVPENRSAKALLDNACWALRAAAAGKPLWRLWGGRPEVDLLWMVTRRPPASMAAEAAEMHAQYGFRTLKVKGGQGRQTDLKVLAEVRAAVGEEVVLSMDANGAYAHEDAASYVRAIADAGVRVAEDPCFTAPNRAFEALQRECTLPLLVDFGCTSSADAALYLDRGAQALMTKPGRVGLSEARAIDAAAAGRAGVSLGVFYESALGAALTPQLGAALTSRQILPAEHSFFLILTAQVSTLVPEVRNGRLRLPDEPDLSRLVDWDAVKRYAI
jgi:L-alanine-DL-glutamate epimerase-like enolase superfamily enzyme